MTCPDCDGTGHKVQPGRGMMFGPCATCAGVGMLMRPAAGLLLVRPVETAEALPGSTIILIADARARMTAHQAEVVARGADALCEDEDCERAHVSADGVLRHACPAQLGDWVLMRPRTAIEGPTPERAEWFLAQDDVLAILREGDGNAEIVA